MSELPEHPATLAPPTVLSPAKRIEAFTGDPNFMTSLARGLAVIHASQERKRHLTIAQISHRTEIPRAAVRRCLAQHAAWLHATTDGRTYSLLPKVLTLGHAYLSSTPLAITAQPILDRLSEQLHEACSMATLEGDDVLYIARSATPQRLISVDLNVGSRLPAIPRWAASSRRAGRRRAARLLRRSGDAGQDQPYPVYPETLLPCLVEIRRQGWCIVDQELEVGLRSLAVPVRDSAGHVLAALNVGTAGRVSRAELESRFLPLLLEASRELSARLFT